MAPPTRCGAPGPEAGVAFPNHPGASLGTIPRMTTRFPSGGFTAGALPSTLMSGGGLMGPIAPGAASAMPGGGPAGRDCGSTPQAEKKANQYRPPSKVLRCKLDMIAQRANVVRI